MNANDILKKYEDANEMHFHEVDREWIIQAMKEYAALSQLPVSGSLPSLDDATKVAVRISEEAIKPPFDAKEQAIFIAGFQECIKWLNVVFGNDH